MVNWYRGMAEYELLLDQRDKEYQTHGAVLHDIGVHILSSLNHSAISALKYDNLYDKIVSALEKPCYPQLMNSYSLQAGRTVAVILSDIDHRIRAYRRKVGRFKSHRRLQPGSPLMTESNQGEAAGTSALTGKRHVYVMKCYCPHT